MKRRPYIFSHFTLGSCRNGMYLILLMLGVCAFAIAGLLCVIDLSKVSRSACEQQIGRVCCSPPLQLQRDNHRSLLEQSTYLVTHYYFIRLPISLLLISVCILTPFAITWKLPLKAVISSLIDTTEASQVLSYSTQNLTTSQDNLNQVVFRETEPVVRQRSA